MEMILYNTTMETKDAFSNFGQNLRRLRKEKGYTQTQLAELSGISQRAIVHCEKHSKRPTLEKAITLAEALDVNLEELLGIEQKKKKKKDDIVSYKLMKKVRVIEQLPTRDQNMIFSLINTLAEKNKLKKNKK